MLEVAKAKAPSARFETGDLTALPLPSDAVDLAVCTLALTHFTHLGQQWRKSHASCGLAAASSSPTFIRSW